MTTLAELRSRELALAGEVEQLRHELRRVRDGLERAGGRDRLLEAKVGQLMENIRFCEEQLELNSSMQKGME